MAVRVTCINKDAGYHENPYVAISHVGWVNDATGQAGRSTRLEMYDFVAGGGYAYVQGLYSKAKLITGVSPKSTKFVKTEANTTEQDNLLKLPEC